MEFKDYYKTLGVAKTASDADIKRAYRKLARKYHPDLNPGDKTAEAAFKDLNEAHEVLANPESRRKYDELGANWRQYEHTAPSGSGPTTGWPGGFSGGAGPGGATYRTMTPEEMEDVLGTNDPFSDFFHTFFSGQAAGRTGRRAGARGGGSSARGGRGQDLDHAIDLTLDEAFAGTSRRLVLSSDGAERTIEVKIPAGIKDGARVRAAGSAPAPKGGTAGDLYLVVRVLPHSRFERKGQDLYTRARVPVTTAVLGGDVSVPTLSGSTLRLRVPELTAAGRVFRLRGQGMPTVARPEERGDLYATIEIEMPSSLTDEARARWEALKALED